MAAAVSLAQVQSAPAPSSELTELRQRSAWMQKQLLDWPQLGRYAEADAKLLAASSADRQVVFMGDSITDIWRLDEYFPGKRYVNRGISGQTTPQMLIRFRPDVIALQPKVVLILAGTNDIAGNTGPMTLEQIEDNLASMSELAKVHGIRVVMSSVLPVNNYTKRAEPLFATRPPAKILELNRWIKAYCKVHGNIYLDYYSAMVDEKGMFKRELTEDGLHPNALGFKIMAPLAEAAIHQALKK